MISHSGPAEVLTVRQVDDPSPGPAEILARVHATALNRADILQREGQYPPPPGVRADIPGLEFAGRVEKTGEKVSLFHPGDRVMGLLPGEGYAEKIVTSERLALPIPDRLSWEEAAAIPEVFMTAFDALFPRLGVKLGERILVHAVASGVGTAVVQLAKAAGVEVFGTAGSDGKLKKAEKWGLDHAINYKKQDFEEELARLTEGRGVDAIVDLVGASHWQKNLRSLAPRGRLVLIGLVGGRRAQIDLSLILKKRLKIEGTVLRSRPLEEKIRLTQELRKHVLPLFESAKIRPVIDRVFPLEEAAEAHRRMEANRNTGKIVLKVV
ncbi:MAG: NAD(P)H-quinone oxidoreductase [Acidobacteriota bacterium]